MGAISRARASVEESPEADDSPTDSGPAPSRAATTDTEPFAGNFDTSDWAIDLETADNLLGIIYAISKLIP